VVVRVVIGSQEAGEFHAFKGVSRRDWRPFKSIEVANDGRPTLVRFTEDEIAEGADLEIPANPTPAVADAPATASPVPAPASTPAPAQSGSSERTSGPPWPVLVAFAVAAAIAIGRGIARVRKGRRR
jgi:hypothetical protein